jgi:hypothetical protein
LSIGRQAGLALARLLGRCRADQIGRGPEPDAIAQFLPAIALTRMDNAPTSN